MDPLSATASLVSVLQLCSDVVKYIISATGSTKARRRLREEILSCEFVLLQLQDHADDANGDTVWPKRIKTLEGPNTPLYRFGIALRTLKIQLEPKKGWNKALQALRWPFDEEEVGKLITAIQREKSLLQIALTSNCIELAKENRRASDRNHVALLELVQAIEERSSDAERDLLKLNTVLLQLQGSQVHMTAGLGDLREHHVNVERRVILDWITPIDYSTQQCDFINRRQEGTGKWLLSSAEFQTWISNDKQTLFCPGIPGAGKTILTSIIVNDLLTRFGDDPNVGIAYLYCSFRQTDDQKAEGLFASLLKQLSQKQCPLPARVTTFYTRHGRQAEKPSLNEILTTLRFVVAAYSQVFIVVDALDECSAYTSSRFLSEIFNLQATCRANILATSRFIPGIMEQFKNTKSLEIRASKQDICAYVDGHILYLPSFVRDSCELQKEIKTKIFNAVDGMFLLTQLHLDSLVGKRSPKALRAALEKLPSGSNALRQAYSDVMDRIESQTTDQIELAQQVLLWISCAKRPLTTVELQHALAVEVGTHDIDPDNFPRIEDMISVCAGLVIVDEESGIIQLVHHTTQEYFEQTRSQWFPNADAYIATICMTYLSFSIFYAKIGQNDLESRESLSFHKLYDYAAHYWGCHAREAQTELNGTIVDFLCAEPIVSRCSQAMMAAKDHCLSNYGQKMPEQMTGLHLAAYFGLRDVTAALLAIGYNPDLKDAHGRTPLSYAAAGGHEAVVHLLLVNDGVSPDSKDSIRGWTPFWYAVAGVHIAVIERLHKVRTVNPDSTSMHGRTPLSWAAEKGYDAVVKLLVDNERVNINATDPEYGCTPLSWAAANGHDIVIKLLLARAEVDPDPKDVEYGRTPLSWAAERGHLAAVETLLTRNEVDVDSKSKYGRTPLWFSKERGHEKVSRVLLANNAVDVGRDYPLHDQIPMWHAAEIGDNMTVELMLRDGADPNSRDEFGRTPLSHAAERGHEVIVQLLLGNVNVKPDLEDYVYGRTPLSWAAANGHDSVVKLLLQQKSVNPDSKSKYGTPLSWASRFGHEAVVKLLLAIDRVEPESKCKCQRTPISYAAERGHEIVVKLLLERRKVSPRSKDTKYGRTPLAWARVNGHEAIVKLLKENF
ncbi:ankyrin repeat-containing domain protein [Xylariaceae sp. FL0255]|nr:ankyrin repeat-containing domain protein [Xylariaceae sp. FL0255]